eukprot:GILI01016047.1.p1 GENE.GILI01016047.1~~GILI01016047.1.p1  ORF type:complete len:220 (+),score=29.08 GILI01016047.1:81-740(+)
MAESSQSTELPLNLIRKERKLKEFRQYLVDKQVVMALVKYLLALKESPTPPENPNEYLLDFFGRYRDPMWDVVEQLQTENADFEVKNAQLQARVDELEREVAVEEVNARIRRAFRILDKESKGEVSVPVILKFFSGAELGPLTKQFGKGLDQLPVYTLERFDSLVRLRLEVGSELYETTLSLIESRPEVPSFKDKPQDPLYLQLAELFMKFDGTAGMQQ